MLNDRRSIALFAYHLDALGVGPVGTPNQHLTIRRVSPAESDEMIAMAKRRNVFARHSWENNFYIERIGLLRDATVLEVFLPGGIDDILAAARERADFLEKVAFASGVFGIRRRRLLNLLSITAHRRSGFDLAISPGFDFLRSSARPETAPRGIPVDGVFQRRFHRDGFESLVQAGLGKGQIAERLRLAIRWSSESRQEPEFSAAVVKTAIGFESLLIANDNESLRGPLAERTAFLLSDDPGVRERLSGAIKKFYDMRSGIVHGGRRRPQAAPGLMLEGADRLLILLAVTLAANASRWSDFATVVEAVSQKRWGAKTAGFVRPFRASYLTRALQLSEGLASTSD